MPKPTMASVHRRLLARRIVRTYVEQMDTTSMILVGSTAIGDAHEDSDIDIYGTYGTMPSEEQWNRISSILGIDKSGEVRVGPEGSTESLAAALRVEDVAVLSVFGPERWVLEIPEGYEAKVGTKSELGVASIAFGRVLFDPRGIWADVQRALVYGEGLRSRMVARYLGELERARGREELIDISLRLVFAHNRTFYPREKDAWFLLEDMVIPPQTRELLRELKTTKDESWRVLKPLLVSSLSQLQPSTTSGNT